MPAGAERPTLTALFLAAVPAPLAPAVRALPELEQLLEGLVEEGRAELPGIELAEAAFLRHLAERLPEDADLGKALDAIRAADLYLACACAQGNPKALAELERRVLSKVTPAVLADAASGASPDDFRQMLRQKLLVPSAGAGPKILSYSGRGPLARWVRAVAGRMAMKLTVHEKRRSPAQSSLDDGVGVVGLAELDVELRMLKSRYREPLRAALQASFTALELEERRVLRMHYLDGMALHQLATIFGTHRSTIARRLKQAREKLLDTTRAALAAQLQLGREELDSLIDLVASQIDLSLSHLVG